MNIKVKWHGYEFEICHDGTRFIALCHKGHDKKRMDRNVWLNILDNTRVNDDLSAALEQGVSEWQSANSTTPGRMGQPHQKITNPNSGRTAVQRRSREWRGADKS